MKPGVEQRVELALPDEGLSTDLAPVRLEAGQQVVPEVLETVLHIALAHLHLVGTQETLAKDLLLR